MQKANITSILLRKERPKEKNKRTRKRIVDVNASLFYYNTFSRNPSLEEVQLLNDYFLCEKMKSLTK